MNKLEEYLKIAKLHKERMQESSKRIKHLFPMHAEDIASLSYDDLSQIEVYTGRFGKLQDLLGSKVFPEICNMYGEDLKELFFIDRLNKMEQMEIIKDAQNWLYIRKIRNQFAHEYPEHPELLANNLNAAYEHKTVLFDCLEKIEKL